MNRRVYHGSPYGTVSIRALDGDDRFVVHPIFIRFHATTLRGD